MTHPLTPLDSSAARSPHSKVKSLDRLAAIAEQSRREGRTVVLCHGVFDLVHLGHVRHIEAARREGDVLIVTLTADAYVNKGPGRPIFTDHMRAEMIAALEYVDWVAVNHAPSAEPVLAAIKPDVYVKGSDYENPDEDITGKIETERNTVESHGGRVVFTKDITFSSSNLINRYLNVYDPPLRDFLDGVRERIGLASVLAMIEQARPLRVAVVGDAIVDEYRYVETMGKSAKENMIATRFVDREAFAGGVFATANHVASFCDQVDVITALGADDSHEDLIRQNLKPNVRLNAVNVAGRPTTCKTRFVEPGYMRKLFEVYSMNDAPIPAEHENAILQMIADRVASADVLIVTDFGHGLIGRAAISAFDTYARFVAVNAQTNSGNQGYNLITKYRKAHFVCVDAPEARLAVGDKYSDIAIVASESLPARIDCSKIVITHGAHGCYTYARGSGVGRIPAFTKTVVDTVGAGDAFLAVASLMAAIDAPMDVIGLVGNAAGAIKVGIPGHRSSVEKAPLVKFLTALLK